MGLQCACAPFLYTLGSQWVIPLAASVKGVRTAECIVTYREGGLISEERAMFSLFFPYRVIAYFPWVRYGHGLRCHLV